MLNRVGEHLKNATSILRKEGKRKAEEKALYYTNKGKKPITSGQKSRQ